MKLIKRDEWVRVAYTVLGGSSAILLNKYIDISANSIGYIPPALLSAYIVLSEDAGAIEKDIASGSLGYLVCAQAISTAKKFQDREFFEGTVEPPVMPTRKNEGDLPSVEVSQPSSELVQTENKLQRIRDITNTVGAVVDIVGKFRGS